MRASLAIALTLVVAAPALATPRTPVLPVRSVLDDPRLGETRAQLQALFDGAARDGLPRELLADKVREGLAKNVPPARIAAVVRGLQQGLAAARAEAQPHLGKAHASPELLKAIAQARAMGLAAPLVDRVLAASGPKGVAPAARAIEVLTDLAQRGFPAQSAARAVSAVASHAPAEIGKMTARAEALLAGGASRSEALDALAQAGASGLGIDHAEQLLHRNVNGPPGQNDDNRGPDRDTSGARGPNGEGHDHEK